MPKVIIIGATSGIGRALALHYAQKGYIVGITGRRKALLEELAAILPGKCYAECFDVMQTEEAMQKLTALIARMENVDTIIVNAGMGHVNPALDWAVEETCIRTNVSGFAAMCNVAMRYFLQRGGGQLAGVSSIAGIRGVGGAPAYSASKAFICNYLESLRGIVSRQKAQIVITNIQPGFIDTAMGQNTKAFWIASPEKAAKQIAKGLERKATQIYVSKRWRFVAWLLRLLPDTVVDKIG